MIARGPMTEAEWLACDDPEPMLAFLWVQPFERKFRLFACACCRGVPGRGAFFVIPSGRLGFAAATSSTSLRSGPFGTAASGG